MLDAHYENQKLADIYDLDSGWSVDRDFYLNLAGTQKKTVLDLGCGTGLICDAYAAKGHDVTGVDPAAAMLDVARKKPNGHNIEWIQAFAQEFRSDKRFDLIIMTGHAFQVLLNDEDIDKTLTVMRHHLKPGGHLVFESRNPNIDWAKKWGQREPYFLPGTHIQASFRIIGADKDRLSFEWCYRFPEETLVSRSTLRFLTCMEIEDRLRTAGLHTNRVLGDWDGTSFDAQTSEEMIFMVQAA